MIAAILPALLAASCIPAARELNCRLWALHTIICVMYLDGASAKWRSPLCLTHGNTSNSLVTTTLGNGSGQGYGGLRCVRSRWHWLVVSSQHLPSRHPRQREQTQRIRQSSECRLPVIGHIMCLQPLRVAPATAKRLTRPAMKHTMATGPQTYMQLPAQPSGSKYPMRPVP